MRIQIASVFGLALITTVSAQTPLPPETRDDEYIRQQLLNAADEALRDRINHLFSVWMADPSDQPRRALVGAHNAVNAYRDIIKALESRDWKIVAPPEPSAKLFPPSLPQAPEPQRERERRNHRRR